MPDEFAQGYISVEKLEISSNEFKHRTSPDIVDVIQPVCLIRRMEDFLVEDKIFVTMPIHGGEIDQRKELVLKTRIYTGDEYEVFPADPVQMDNKVRD
jgi:hypothetical protein